MKHKIQMISILVLLTLVLTPTALANARADNPSDPQLRLSTEKFPPGLAKAQSEMRLAKNSLAKGHSEEGQWIFSSRYMSEQNCVVSIEFKNQLYFGYCRFNETGEGAQMFRTSDGITWEEVIQPGFGNDLQPYGLFHSTYISPMFVFQGMLYAGFDWWYTDNATFWTPHGGQMWRTADGTNWEKVIDLAGDPNNEVFSSFAEYHGVLYASTVNWFDGAEIWKSPTGNAGDWMKIADNSLNTGLIAPFTVLIVYRDLLFLYIESPMDQSYNSLPVQIWYTEDTINWTLLTDDGFGDPLASNYWWSFLIFKGDFYIDMPMYDPVTDHSWRKVMRSSNGTDWSVCDGCSVLGTIIEGALYQSWWDSGPVVMRSKDLINWEQVNLTGFDDPYINGIWPMGKFKDELYFLATDSNSGYQVWRWCQSCK